MGETKTNGNVIVENIKIGDIHYEFDLGYGIKCEVISLPVRSNDGYWTWESRNCNFGNVIEYGVREGFPHYAPKLYDYEAYRVEKYI